MVKKIHPTNRRATIIMERLIYFNKEPNLIYYTDVKQAFFYGKIYDPVFLMDDGSWYSFEILDKDYEDFHKKYTDFQKQR